MAPLKQWVPAILAWSLLGCQTAPPEPAPEPDHLVEDVQRLGAELLACRQAEHERLLKEAAALDVELAKAKTEIAAYRGLLGEAEYRRIMGDGGARKGLTPNLP